MRKTMSRYFVPLVIAAGILTVLGSGISTASITTPLTRNSTYPHYFSNNGQPVIFLGAGQVCSGNKTENYRAYIDELAAHKVNYARVWALNVWNTRGEYFPWARDGGGTATDGLGKFNLTHWDSNYWSRLKDACAYAQSKNIYLGIMLFERCGMDTPSSSSDHRWDWHPFNPNNNVNGLSLPTSPNGLPEFYDLSNSKLLSLQELYVSKLIAETKDYPNVNYEVCNEYTGGWTWEQHWVDYLNARSSNMNSVNHLGSPSETPSSAWSYSGLDFVKIHANQASASPSTINSFVTSTYSHNKPVVIDETPEVSTISYTNYRNMLWAAFVGGGHMHLENGVNPGPALDAVNYIWSFINTNGVRWWEMSPNNSVVTSDPGGTAYTLAKSGSEYVTYIVGSGSGSMSISLPSGTYTAKAFNPSNGTYTNLTVSGTTVSGIPSYSSDIVIYVKKSASTSTGTPSVSISYSVDKSTAVPGSTITYTATYKNSGTGTAQNVNVSGPVPSNTTYVSGSGGTYDSATRTVKWTISSVSAGASGSVTYKVTVN